MTTKQQQRRERLTARLSLVRHWLLGSLAVPPVPGTVFDPRAFFLDPGRYRDCLAYWAARAGRDGCGAGLPRRLRAAACEQAAQVCLAYFLDADYAELGVTADEFARAVLMAYKLAKRRFWRDAAAHRDAERERANVRREGWYPYNRAANSRTPDPARIVAAAEALGADPQQAHGHGCSDVPGNPVSVPGGPSGRGETDGHMECVTVKCVAFNETREDGTREELAYVETRWRMKRGRGKARTLPSCTVDAGNPAPVPRFNPPPLPRTLTAAGLVSRRPIRERPDGLTDCTEAGERRGGVRHYVRLG